MPDYASPPIDEVVVGVVFADLPLFSEPHVGLYWNRVRDAFPNVETQPRLEPTIEDLSNDGPGNFGGLRIALPFGPGVGRRTWLKSADDAYLIQLQNSLFLFNWRRRSDAYPHFDTLLAKFETYFGDFRALLSDEHMPAPSVRQVEVSYINWIDHAGANRLLLPATSTTLASRGVGPESVEQVWLAKYMIHGDEDRPIGRLSAAFQPVARQVQGEIKLGVQFELTARFPTPNPPDEAQLHLLFERGRDVIVRAFTDLTTAEAHERWERIQ